MERAETRKHNRNIKGHLDSRKNRLYMLQIQSLKYTKFKQIFADVHNYLFISNICQIFLSSAYVNKRFHKSKRQERIY